MRSIYSACGMMTLFVVVGCGPSGPALGTVKGKVTLNGRPLPNALVTFEPEGGGPVGTGPTDAEGKFELYSAGRKGAKIGNHRVVITTIQEAQPAAEPPGAKSSDDPAYMAQPLGGAADYKKAEQMKEKIPAKYNQASELKQEVKAGKNEVNFDLK